MDRIKKSTKTTRIYLEKAVKASLVLGFVVGAFVLGLPELTVEQIVAQTLLVAGIVSLVYFIK